MPVLTSITGKCPVCDETRSQIDSTRERAFKVVEAALRKHCAEAHPDFDFENGGSLGA